MRGADFDRLERAAQRAAEREAEGRADPEPSLGARFGQIGVLGWTIIVPTLLCLFLGRWIDRTLGTGIFFSAPLLMAGAAIGFWSAWRWMLNLGRASIFWLVNKMDFSTNNLPVKGLFFGTIRKLHYNLE